MCEKLVVYFIGREITELFLRSIKTYVKNN